MTTQSLTTKAIFLDSLKGTTNRELADFLIQNDDDLSLFIDNFIARSKSVFQAIMAFRLYRMRHTAMSLEAFLLTMNVRPIETLELFFQHRVTEQMYELLKRRIEMKRITLENLHFNRMKYPEYQLSYYIL